MFGGFPAVGVDQNVDVAKPHCVSPRSTV
jgi:hypothetical protein